MRLEFDVKTSPLPLPDRVASYFRAAILAGRLRIGDYLPSCNSVEGVSHVTILKAYRQLARERLVATSRARGTIVINNQRKQYYLFLSYQSQNTGYYELIMINKILAKAHCDGVQPYIHFFKNIIPDIETAENTLPENLREDILNGRIRGVLASRSKYYPGIIKWLHQKQVQLVELVDNPVQNSNSSLFDVGTMVLNGINYFQKEGINNIQVIGHSQSIKKCLARTGIDPTTLPDVCWHSWDENFNRDGAVAVGRKIAAELLGNITGKFNKPLGFFILDDWVALGFFMTLGENGLRPSRNMRFLVACSESYLLSALNGCEFLVVSMDELVSEAVKIIEDAINNNKRSSVISWIPYKLKNPDKIE